MPTNLWGEEFSLPDKKEKTNDILKKVSNPKNISREVKVSRRVKNNISMPERIAEATAEVRRILKRFQKDIAIIRSVDELESYIDRSIENGIISIDTETNNSLDPLTCKLMGPCLYTPGMKQAYIPMHHINPKTSIKLDNQITEEEFRYQLERLQEKEVKIIMHNASFDYSVIKQTEGISLDIYWDTLIGAKILNENERSYRLKDQYVAKIDNSMESYSVESIFKGIPYELIDPETFGLYAATDPYMTYKLYELQRNQFELPGNEELYKLFIEVEMPVITVVADMQLVGVDLDKEYSDLLSAKYHKILENIDIKIRAELDKHKHTIDAWSITPEARSPQKNKKGEYTAKSKFEQLADPINLSSPTQLAILFYDILKYKSVDRKSPRGTGEAILRKFGTPLSQLIVERRGIEKLLSTFIDTLPKRAHKKTGRVHCNFNQLGAATGRFSSSDPNLQNIPSSNKEIRMMFKATEGYVLISSDFSQQEPRLLSAYSKDSNMMTAYKQGRDLYATMATAVYKNKYEDNLETFPDGTANVAGKRRRDSMKNVLLGIMYGRGAASIAEQLGMDVREALKTIDEFYDSFPDIKKWMDTTLEEAKRKGYVEDMWGRRRHLPELFLPEFEIQLNKAMGSSEFNPFLWVKNRENRDSPLIRKYEKAVQKVKSIKDFEDLRRSAQREGVYLKDNRGYIRQAERQCVNARVQGGAASMTKVAMIRIHNDPTLRKLGYRLLLTVHDELIGEVPLNNVEEAAKIVSKLMSSSAEDVTDVPFKCSPDIATCWYLNEYQNLVKEEFTNLLKQGKNKEEAFKIIADKRPESTHDQLLETLAEFL